MPFFHPVPPGSNSGRSWPSHWSHFPSLTPSFSSVTIRLMAKARKASSGSSGQAKGTAHGHSNSLKKKNLPPAPPAQRGGVELVDPLVQAQLKTYDEALGL